MLVALLLLLLAQLELAFGEVEGSELAAHLLWIGVAAAALLRRREPLLFAAVAIAFLAIRFRFGLTPEAGAASAIVTPLALYGIGAYGEGALRSAVAAGFATAIAAVTAVLVAEAGYGPLAGAPTVEWVGQISIYVAAAAGGIALRDRTEALARAGERTAAIPSEREAIGEALGDERRRIARELHGLVAACVHQIGGAAARARAAVRSNPDRAQALLGEIFSEARSALAEMRRLLALLRPEWGNGAARIEAPATPASLDELERRINHNDALTAGPAWARAPAPLRRQGLPLLVLAVGVPEAVLVASADPALYGSASTATRLLGVVALALAFVPRRRLPLLSVVAAALVLTARVALFDDLIGLNLPLYLIAFVAGAYSSTLLGAATGGAVAIATAFTIPALVGVDLPLSSYVFITVTVASAWGIGFGGRRRLAQAEELHRLAETEEEERRRAVERALAAQRQEVARDLHDLVGHGLTAITLEAAGARKLLPGDPPAATAAVETIVETVEVVERELVVLLAALDGRAESAPPSLGELERLRRISATPSRPIRLEVRGDPDAVPAGPGAAGYRIVQEALQNASKHGGEGEVGVLVAARADELFVEVSSQVRDGGSERGNGMGLIGMRERATLYGGELDCGSEGGRWIVRARLPLEPPG